MARPTSDDLPSALISNLLFEVELKIRGKKAASALQESTNLNHMTFRRNGAMALVKHAEAIQTYQREVWLPKAMRAWGASETEIVETISKLEPSGAVAFTVFAMGFRGPDVSTHLAETVALLDQADASLLRLRSIGDMQGCLAELGPDSPLGPEYCRQLDVAGIGPLSGTAPADDLHLLDWVRVRRAHMALSLLAAIDHEMTMWRERQVNDEAWTGIPRFAVLLLDPNTKGQKRQRPDDPIARLVDLVGTMAASLESGCWPDSQPSLGEMGSRVDRSNLVDLTGERFIKKIRSGELPMTDRNFRTLVVSQLKGVIKPVPFDPLALASMLIPYLFAAHLLTKLIPRDQNGRRLVRTGWRSEYLAWWRRHAIALNRPTERANDAVPLWLTGPGDTGA